MSSNYVYVMNGLSKVINGKVILHETNLSFLPGAKIGVIGNNGAGKSTMLKIIAGIDREYDGEAFVAHSLKVGYLPQEPILDSNANVLDNIIIGLKEKTVLLDRFYEVSNKLSNVQSDEELSRLLEEQSELQSKIDISGAWDIERELEVGMMALKCPDKSTPIATLSGGEKRRVALCRLLLEKPDLLLLDEPTNHLDAESVSWLEHYLKHYSGTVIVVTHDRYFLDNVTDWILELDRGRCVPWHCNYTAWLEHKSIKLESEEREDDARKKQIKREFEWISQAPKARQAKSKYRISAYQELLAIKREKVVNGTQIIIPNGPRLGDIVIEVNNLCKAYGEKTLISNLSFNVPAGAIVGITGGNGLGKTTLFNIISGLIPADSGTVKLGETVKLGYVNQLRDALDNNKTVWEEISGGLEELQLGSRVMKSRAYCAAFNFKGSLQQKTVGLLSGGERNRVHLAKLLKEGANVLLLDEPSNDLDLDTLRSLEEAILDFAGCVLIISHDRWFLDRVATHIIAYDSIAGNISWFEGNYQSYCDYLTKSYPDKVLENKYRHKKFR